MCLLQPAFRASVEPGGLIVERDSWPSRGDGRPGTLGLSLPNQLF